MEDALKRRIAAAITSLALSNILSSAWAEDQSVPKTPEPKDELVEVVVTGSRIRRPELDRLQPTTVLNSEYIERGAYANVIDALSQLPAFGEPESSLLGSQSSFGVGQSFAESETLRTSGGEKTGADAWGDRAESYEIGREV